MPPLIDLTGHRFGLLTVVRRATTTTLKPHWLCRCDCGQMKAISGSDLKLGKSRSCGCRVRAAVVARCTKHGGANRSRISAEWYAWQNMKGRCYRQSSSYYKDYGGRGIRVCDKWRGSFTAFINDMGPHPFPHATIERIDTNGHYEPDNCRWATPLEQANNKRNTVVVEYQGERMSLATLSRLTKRGYGALLRRITKEGQSAEQAVAALRPYRPRR